MKAMSAGRYFVFEPFCLDMLDERLWKHQTSVPLGHKAFGVLARLVTLPDQLVTKEELLASVWPDTAVTDAVLTTAIREIRVAVGDRAGIRRFIQTVHGRGYRFIAPVVARGADLRSRVTPVPDTSRVVGRHAESARLDQWFSAIQEGTRRVGVIAGEAGIGKTTLVDAFVAGIEATTVVRVGRGQCIEQYGAGEAYLPILEALGRLARGPDRLVERVLRERAPSWLAHLPAVAPPAVEPTARVPVDRMLRELTDVVEGLATVEPLVLVLEDLHWSDRATLEWLAYVTRRRDPARLLILGTYRPLEARLHTSPLRAVLGELRHQPQSAEIVLDYLSLDAVRSYVRHRCGSVDALEDLAGVLHRRTGGHPLFLAGLVDDLIQQQAAAQADSRSPELSAIGRSIPLNVRQFIEHRFEHLGEDDRAILEAASVAGDPFSVAAVAAGTSLSEERIEARCAVLTHDHRILTSGGVAAWPDGTLGAEYHFRHALFHETAYARVSSERRARLHHLIGCRLEKAYAGQTPSIAAELAVHFEQGRDLRRAVSYLEQAARNALHRSAYPEAHRLLARGLKLIDSLPDGPERLRHEANLVFLLAQVLETTRGWGADEVSRAYARSRELCLLLGDEPGLLQATWGLIAVSIVRGELRMTQALGRDLLRLAKKRGSPVFRMAAHTELGGTALVLGETTAARRHFLLAEMLSDPSQHQTAVAAFGMDMGIFARIWATHLMWHEGYPQRARARADDAMDAAALAGHPFTRTVALAYAAMLSQFRRDVSEVDRLTHAVIAHATEHGFPYYLAWAQVLRDWSRASQGAGDSAVAGIRAGIDALQAMARLRLPYYRALFADACGRIGRPDEGLQAISDAFMEIRRTEERWWEAELHRLRGDLLMASAGMDPEAEHCFRTAIEVARGQRARSLELRATVSLARLWCGQGKRGAARLLLARVYDQFTEGFDTPDLQDAQRLLEERP